MADTSSSYTHTHSHTHTKRKITLVKRKCNKEEIIGCGTNCCCYCRYSTLHLCGYLK